MAEQFSVITDGEQYTVAGVGVLHPGRIGEVVAVFYMNAPSGDRRLLMGTQTPVDAEAGRPGVFMFIPPETSMLARLAMSPDNFLTEFMGDRDVQVGAISAVKKIKELRPDNW